MPSGYAHRNPSSGGAATILAVGVIGFAAWKIAQSGGFRGLGLGGGGGATATPKAPNAGPAPVATGTVNPAPATAPLTQLQQYNEVHADGWYQVTQWSDGHYDFTFIPPEQYANYGIPQYGIDPNTGLLPPWTPGTWSAT